MNQAVDAGMEIHLKAGMNVVIEAGVSLTLQGPGGFVNIGPAGVAIQGIMVLINSGGAAGSGSGSSPQSPQAAQEAQPKDPDQGRRRRDRPEVGLKQSDMRKELLMPPAARMGDMHVCPMVDGIVPHVGGPILPPCEITVLIGFQPAARVTDMAALRRAARRDRHGLDDRPDRRPDGRADGRHDRARRRDRHGLPDRDDRRCGTGFVAPERRPERSGVYEEVSTELIQSRGKARVAGTCD